MRILICGGRRFSDYELLSDVIEKAVENVTEPVEIVSGHCAGADMLAERYANEHNISLTVMKPEWRKYGRAAGVIRNRQMLEYVSETSALVLAFWDGISRGTKNTIETARKMGINVIITLYR